MSVVNRFFSPIFASFIFCILFCMRLNAAELPEHIRSAITQAAQQNLGPQFTDILVEHQKLPEQMHQCAQMQYQPREPVDIGKQYIKFIGCGLNRLLPVTISANINVPVAKETIEKSIVLSAEHFIVKTINIRKRMKYFVPVDAVIGRTTKRQIRANKIIADNLLKTEYLVEKGSMVNFTVAHQGFVISTEMVSRENGVLGQRVRLQHPVSKKRNDGIVTGFNQVSAMSQPQIEPVIVIKDKRHNINK